MKRFSNILAIVNTSRNDNSALQRAVSVMNSNLASLAAAEELERLEEFVTVVGGNEALIEKEVLVGRPFLEVIHQVLKRDHDLVIKFAKNSVTPDQRPGKKYRTDESPGVGCGSDCYGNVVSYGYSRLLHRQHFREHPEPG